MGDMVKGVARWKYVGGCSMWTRLRSLRPEEHGGSVSPTVRHIVVLKL